MYQYFKMRIHWFFKVLLLIFAVSIFWSVFYFGLPKVLPKQHLINTQVYGLIFSDQTWEGEIYVVGDIYSLTGSTITVLPGSKIIVSNKSDKSNLDFLPWHQKSGINTGLKSKGVENGEPFWDESEKIQIHLNNLIILGQEGNEVEIRSNSNDGSPYDFNVLSIKKGRISHTNFSNYRRFESGGDLVISNSIFKNTGECSLCFSEGRPKVYGNTFEKSLKESIYVERASPEISNNLFINLFGNGIKIDSKKLSAPQITKNTFEMPRSKPAINIISGGQLEEGLIEHNFFAGNSFINIACDAKVKIRDNIILGQISFSNGCNGKFTFGPNYWGTPDSKTIMIEKILNKYDAFLIQIPSVLLSPPKQAGR